jgi:hypothetical protein
MATLAHLVLSLAAALALSGHPATAGTRLPVGVREVDVDSRSALVRVTDGAKVARIIHWFDELRIAPSTPYFCPLIRYKRPTTFDFRSASGLLLAHARIPGRAACGGSIDFNVRGRAQKPLLLGHFLGRVGRLLGIRLVSVYR